MANMKPSVAALNLICNYIGFKSTQDLIELGLNKNNAEVLDV